MKSDVEKRIAVQYSAHINAAYHCLCDPIERARYLLKLKDVVLLDEETLKDVDFLMLQLTWQEQIQQANDSDSKFLNDLLADLGSVMDKEMNLFQQHFVIENWNECKQNIMKMQFIQKCCVDIESKRTITIN